MGKIEGDVEGVRIDDLDGARSSGGSVTRPSAERARPWAGDIEGSDGSDTALRGEEERGIRLFQSDDEMFGGGAFIDDDVGGLINGRGDAEAAALAEGV